MRWVSPNLVPEIAAVEARHVRAMEEVVARDRLKHQQVRGLGLVPTGQHGLDGVMPASGVITRSVQPSSGLHAPTRSEADSSACMTVVPMAMTLPPASCAGAFTRAALNAGTFTRSG